MIVVTDTSVILNLCRIRQQQIIPLIFGRVVSPPSVKEEFERLAEKDSRFTNLRFPDFIEIAIPPAIHPALAKNNRLHRGEIEALSLAFAVQADSILIDERAGRNAASELGIICIGILGILIRAKEIGLLNEVSPLLDQLETEARFWISPALKRQVLARLRET